jgi:uncharacterized protein YutE (UPF0331/DUF86 family)
MTKDIADVIKRKLKELEQNLIYLKQISYDINLENLKSDMIRYWGIERGIQICIECIIDIANVIISVSGKEKPDTYREIMLKMSDLGIVSEKFSKKLANMAGFRNILVHDYTKIDEEIIINILKNDINDFIKYTVDVRNWMKDNGY